ncbi:MAG: hypothetical protein AB7F28_03960 [Candidatus Margulisiibacteriota bacterium]
MTTSPNLFIKYTPQPQSDIDLQLLGTSLIGFEKVIKECFKISKIDGNLEVKAKNLAPGSIVVEIALKISTELPFVSIQDMLVFYKVANPDIYAQIINGFSDFKSIHETVNDLVAKYPLDCALIGWFVSKIIEYAKRQKKSIQISDDKGEDLPEKTYAKALYRMINKDKVFKKALKPFVEDELRSIQISPERNFDHFSEITSQNFENYLPEDARILPQYQNGQTVDLTGKLVGLQKSKGDSLSIRVHGIEKEYSLLVGYPDDDHASDDYLRFYGKDIVFKAEILRKSLYQKPKLKIIGIPIFHQPELFDQMESENEQ